VTSWKKKLFGVVVLIQGNGTLLLGVNFVCLEWKKYLVSKILSAFRKALAMKLGWGSIQSLDALWVKVLEANTMWVMMLYPLLLLKIGII